ncbi:energy-coupling factor transporter transmembrane component T family protein [Gracilinema caldarium]|uniref:ABC-type transporter, integral membrane subunit n=1 Tax=Gracilinema caldarium (strain ATCC 51460 / DSM 7334 / H1) TaxID=744872 RepID=F8EXA2_GRAC1|nr:energy-coupling factor transporter transmembrane component T [Gracilinema caldarium]AEJ18845.1 ABC-type transporter, integral membrane subunit [Gracilinema caldarium DSM 7334]
MNKSHTVDNNTEYCQRQQQSWKPNPLALLLAQLFIMIPVLFAMDKLTPLSYLALGLINLFLVARLEFQRFIRLVLPLSTLSFGLFFMNLFFPAEGVNGLDRAIAVFLRSFTLICLSSGYILAASPYDIIRALMQNWHLSYRFGFSLFAGWNTIPLLKRDIEIAQKAQEIRLAGSRGKTRKQFRTALPKRSLTRLPITILSGAILHGERLSLSMAGRGLEKAHKRTFIHRIVWSKKDTLYDIGVGFTALILWLGLIRVGIFVFELG